MFFEFSDFEQICLTFLISIILTRYIDGRSFLFTSKPFQKNGLKVSSEESLVRRLICSFWIPWNQQMFLKILFFWNPRLIYRQNGFLGNTKEYVVRRLKFLEFKKCFRFVLFLRSHVDISAEVAFFLLQNQFKRVV